MMKTFTIALIGISILSSCARKMTFLPSSVVPGAEGSVKVKTDKNKNYAIDLEVVNLASPEKLQPPKTNYVVWLETDDNGVKNIGSLQSSQGLFSKAWKGSLETVTPYKPEKFFITAEDEVSPQYPGMQIVLNTGGFEVK
jgi:hypothetical protein